MGKLVIVSKPGRSFSLVHNKLRARDQLGDSSLHVDHAKDRKWVPSAFHSEWVSQQYGNCSLIQGPTRYINTGLSYFPQEIGVDVHCRSLQILAHKTVKTAYH